MPPPWDALLPDRVLPVTVSVPWLKIPPPPPLTALLPDRVLSVTVGVPPFQIPPPPLELLPDRVLSVTLSVPSLLMPAPCIALPFWIVSPEMSRYLPLYTLRTVWVFPPSRVGLVTPA